jgi:molybdopterin synthase catalytic subunit
MSITEKPIDLSGAPKQPNGECGAAVTFLGVVRSPNKGREVTGIVYECYREMAEVEVERIIADVKKSYAVSDVTVVHRIGRVGVGEISLLVVVWAAHRGEAFEASQSIVHELKRRVPIWKKELYGDATSQWV